MLQRLLNPRDARAKARSTSGFTLIELLIVIVILGVLAGVVVFAVSAFNNRGEEAACKSDFKAVEVAAEAYRANTGTYPASIDALVPDYLREPPSSPNCTISLAADGTLSVSGIYNETTGGGGPAPTTTTTAPPQAPGIPGTASVGSFNCTSVTGPDPCTATANWGGSTGSPTPTYEWEVDSNGFSGGGSCVAGDFSGGTVDEGTATGTSAGIDQIFDQTNYCFRVRAVNGVEPASGWQYAAFTTPEA